MRLTCPSCAASYDIKAEALGPAGRTVRCASCGTKWFATPEVQERPHAREDLPVETDERAASVAPPPPDIREPPAQPIADRPSAEAIVAAVRAATPRADSIEAVARRRERPRKMSRHRAIGNILTPRGIGWAVVVGAIVLCGGAFVARQQVVAVIPGTAGVFALLGHPVNLAGLDIEGVATRVEFEGTQAVLVVEGLVRNMTANALVLPRLRFAVRDTAGNELVSWPEAITRQTIAPGERLPFRTRLTSAPRNGNDVEVRFVGASDARVGAL